MITISLNDQITNLEKILPKTVENLTFKDVMSLIFHATIFMTRASNTESSDTDTDTDTSTENWIKFYDEFKNDFAKQNDEKWPKLFIIKNNYYKRIDINTSSSFTKSKNLLMLLLRLLYVENYKRTYVFKSYKYHKILSHKIPIKNITEIKKISLSDLFDSLKTYINYYLKIYNDNTHYEYILGKSIISQL